MYNSTLKWRLNNIFIFFLDMVVKILRNNTTFFKNMFQQNLVIFSLNYKVQS